MSTGNGVDYRIPASLGVGAVAVTLGGIFVAAALTPWFSVFGNALSHLGARGQVAAPIFNGSLVLGGILGAGFVAGLWELTTEPLRKAGLFFALLAVVCMAFVGRFPIPSGLHFVFAVLFFFFLTVAVFLWGGGDYADGRHERGLALILGATVHLVVWVWWILFPWLPRGIAIPELVGSFVLAIWVIWVSLDLYRAMRVEAVTF